VTSALLLKVTGATVAAEVFVVLLVLLVLFWLAGLYRTRRYWQAFRDDEIAGGGSARTAQEKWHKMYPPGAG
jgi:ABC-type branched-subunit amino acid transport system permease subunit